MNLKDYYNNLPARIAPKQDFVEEVAKRCGVTATTVKNWVLYGLHPQRYEHVKVLMELSGLTEEELWEK